MTRSLLRSYVCRSVAYAIVALAGSTWVATTQADVLLTNGSLSVSIRSDNGAIGLAKFGGSDYFNPGSSVSDFGLQAGGNIGAFQINTTTGITQTPVAVNSVAGTAVVTGTYTGGGANLSFERTYSLVAGTNVLRVSTNLTNNGAASGFQLFDTFDPDQGIDQGNNFNTFNDVFGLGGGTVGQATDVSGLTVIGGTLNGAAAVAAGSPFNIGDGSSLNSFLAAPFDGNGASADQGLHLGLDQFLAAGGSANFTYDLAFGLTAADAQNQFLQANTPVPEPASLAVWGLATIAGAGWARRKRAHA